MWFGSFSCPSSNSCVSLWVTLDLPLEAPSHPSQKSSELHRPHLAIGLKVPVRESSLWRRPARLTFLTIDKPHPPDPSLTHMLTPPTIVTGCQVTGNILCTIQCGQPHVGISDIVYHSFIGSIDFAACEMTGSHSTYVCPCGLAFCGPLKGSGREEKAE